LPPGYYRAPSYRLSPRQRSSPISPLRVPFHARPILLGFFVPFISFSRGFSLFPVMQFVSLDVSPCIFEFARCYSSSILLRGRWVIFRLGESCIVKRMIIVL
jgi:hypothetical protein